MRGQHIDKRRYQEYPGECVGEELVIGINMALWKVVLTTSVGEFGNPLLNVFGYYATLPVTDEANALMDAVEAQLLPKINECQNGGASIVQQEVFGLDGGAYAVRTYPVSTYRGGSGGDIQPPFVAYSFKLVKSVLGKRSGGKRIGPLSVGDNVGRSPVGSAIVHVEDLRAQLAVPLVIGLIETWFPVILERPHPPSTTWGQHAIGGCLFDAVSTQNTRKK